MVADRLLLPCSRGLRATHRDVLLIPAGTAAPWILTMAVLILATTPKMAHPYSNRGALQRARPF